LRGALFALLIVALTGVAAFWGYNTWRANEIERFDETAADTAELFRLALEQSDATLRSLQALYIDDPNTDQSRFERFVRTLSVPPGLRAVAYHPRVTESDRAAFEAALRGSGRGLIGIWDAAEAEGRAHPPEPSNIYFPMAASFYFDGGSEVIGFDPYTQTAHRETIDALTDTGRATSSGLIRTVPGRHSPFVGFTIYRPVYRNSNLAGVVSAWVETAGQLQAARSRRLIVKDAELEVGPLKRELLFASDDVRFARTDDADPLRAVFEKKQFGHIWKITIEGEPTARSILLGYGMAGLLLISGLGAAGAIRAYDIAHARRQGLLAAEDLRRRTLDGLVPLVWLTKPGGEIVEANQAARTAERAGDAVVAGKQFARLPLWGRSGENQKALAKAVEAASRGEEVQLDANGWENEDRRPVYHVSIRPVRNLMGKISHLAISALDVSERAEAVETERLLLREIDHRMKNTLQVLQGIVRRTARSHDTVKSFEKALMGRIMAMARAHQLLADERWQSANLRNVVLQELDTFEDAGPVPSVTGAPIRVNTKAALSFALAVHELGTNALKYGALSVPTGRISIDWTVEGEMADRKLVFLWRESGGPRVKSPTQRGFGSLLLERIISYDLDGETALDFAPDGLACSIVIPWKQVRPTVGHSLHSVTS
jgi:two-component sensor histidine kinase/CHASE1-domain containing sensor protein